MSRQVIFIVSSGHSGSTMIDLVLGSHPRGFSCGELSTVARSAARTCGIDGDDCPFWKTDNRLEKLHEQLKPFQRSSGLKKLLPKTGSSSDAYSTLLEWADAEFLIDSSKSLWWMKQHEKSLRRANVTPRLLYLVRDARAVLNSYLRKYPDTNIADWANQYLTDAQNRDRFFERYPEADRVLVTYEAFTEDPISETSRICKAFGMDFQEQMLEFWKHDHHIISGNRGTRSLIHRFREQFAGAKADTWNSDRREFYDQLGLAIQPDLRWKEELSEQALDEFERVAGEYNQAVIARN